MQRLCICTFWQKDGIVGDYFKYYLDGLKEVCEKIIVVVNGEINSEGREKLKDFEIIQRENKGFDFWAWKTAIEKTGYKELEKYDELVLTNCTCYGPLYPFSEVFNEMGKKDCDFWGITKHPANSTFKVNKFKIVKITEYVQSYFLVIKKNLFTSKHFIKFWKKLRPVSTYEEAVVYHKMYFTKFFEDKGFISNSYIPECTNYNPTFISDILLDNHRLPIIKRKYFFHNNC